MNSRISLAIALLISSCSGNTVEETATSSFSNGRNLGLIDKRLPEASGIASSIANPGYIWSVNDSGNPAKVYLIDTTAHVKLTCKLPVDNRDWEEVAVGPGPDANKTYVYVGEIGDNNAAYDTKYVYRFEEPVAGADSLDVLLTDTLKIQMPDGKRDTETMMIDPFTKDLYLISKREDSVSVYESSAAVQQRNYDGTESCHDTFQEDRSRFVFERRTGNSFERLRSHLLLDPFEG